MDILKGISGHRWNFRRVGGIYQAQINTVEDLKALPTLDPKLWVALSCPVNDLEVDPKTLKLIDNDLDERVRIEEILAAVEWTLARMSKPEALFEPGPLPLNAISTVDQEGQALKASAEQILANIGKDDAPTISVEEAANTAKIFGQSRLNGDGVIAADATDDSAVRQLIQEIIDLVGATQDRSGEVGVTQAKLDDFHKQLVTFESWWTMGEVNSAKGEDIFPLGEDTPSAFAALLTVEKKIDDFFARCHLAAFDPRAEEALNQDVSIFKTIANEDFSSQRDEVEKMPLARIAARASLPISTGINPAWTYRVDNFIRTCVGPLLKKQSECLDEETWQTIKARYSGYRNWRVAKPETGVESLGIERIREILNADTMAKLKALLDEDRDIAPKMQAVQSVEKLARYHRDLIRVLNNFVNFNDFYDKKTSASFQAGVLYLDGRECRLCLKVDNPQKHSAIAALSRAYIAYCECRRKDAPNKFHIAAIFSNGDSANMMVGRNGIFRDQRGKLWDATIVRLTENPISIREAFFSPYIRIGRFIGDQMEKWAVSRDKAIQKQMETGVESAGGNNGESNKSGSNIGGIAGMVAAGGIAIGAIGAGLASLFNTFKNLDWWEFPVILFSLILVVSLPSMLIAWLKIRKRTLAPLLDASGWAVNGRTLISFALGRTLTLKASIPISAQCNFDERLRVRVWLWFILGFTVVASSAGWFFLFLN